MDGMSIIEEAAAVRLMVDVHKVSGIGLKATVYSIEGFIHNEP